MDSPSSNSNIHTIVKAQIVFLLSTLTEDNFERNQIEIRSLSEQHGFDTYLHFIRRLIVHSQARLSATAPPPAFDTSSALTFRLLIQETQRLARDSFLAERFREGIDKGEGDVFRNFDLIRFADRVGLRPLERLVLAASIVAGQTRKELASQAQAIIRMDFESAVLALCQHPSFDHADLSPSSLEKLMQNLLQDPPDDSPVLDAMQRQALILAAQTKYGSEIVTPYLQRILPNLTLPPATTVVQVLQQLGPEITEDPDLVLAVFLRFGLSKTTPPREDQVIEIVATFARLASENALSCDVSSVIRAINSFNLDLDWPAIIRSFDRPERVVDTATLKLLISILLSAPRHLEPHAVAGFWSSWENPMYQLRLLDALLSLPADTFNFVSLPGRRIVTVDDVANASPTIKSLAANVQGQTWNSLDLFEVLVIHAGSESPEIRNYVREMLDKAVKISAELVHMGLLQVPQATWNEIRLEYAQKLLAMFLAGHPNHQLVFMRIWQIDPPYLTNAFRDFYNESPLNITRILDVAQDLKILDSLLEVRPFTFALDVAALASRREYLNLDKWLADNVNNHGAEFLHSVIEFLDIKMESEKATRITDPAVDHRTMPLNPQTIAIFLRVLRNSSAIMHESDVDYCLEVRNACLQIHPRLMVLTPGSDTEPGFTVVAYAPEIEAEVDAIYKQMYDEQITIDEVIAMLQRNKTSSNARDHEIFSCMLHFLFDEYKFFQAFYPPRELAMTGYLFGSIIQYELVDYIPLGIAIRYVLDALNCSPESNLFKFGIQALRRFESRLSEWQPLCQALLKIPHLLEAQPELAPILQRAIANAPEGMPTAPEFRILPAVEPAPIFAAIQPDKVDDEVVRPSEEVSDKILFIVNNLAPNNFDSKLAEMKDHFKGEHARWFANYLVDQRISTEPNNHPLYLRFLDALDGPVLSKFILHETYVKSATLLNSERTAQSSSERAILKNIGVWLGTITLARDKPIKHKNLSFKDLLMEGYDNNRLIVVIPFVCRTLEPAVKSTVFKPPNPWMMAIISLLAELYHFAELKLNLKFEIEMLCTALDINLDAIEATSVLRNRPLSDTLAGPPLPDYVPDIDALPIGGYDPSSQIPEAQVLGLGPTSPSDVQRSVGAHIESILSSLSQHIVINAQLGPLAPNQLFKRSVQLAVDRSVREIILPVVERSVTIAGISTRELVAKDFVTEGNEEKLRKAGHLMAQRLAGSLALVTCKEPLKSNLATHMRQYLLEQGFTEQIITENVILLLVQDNLDIACAAIEKAAMDRAIVDVDEGFATSYELRRRHREQRTAHHFWDHTSGASNFSGQLPDPLRIRQAGVQSNQLLVYEDFAGSAVETRRRLITASRPSSTVSYSRTDLSSMAYPPTPVQDPLASVQRIVTHQEAMQRFTLLIQDLEGILTQMPVQSLASLPPNHEIREILRAILFVTRESVDRERTPILTSQKIVQFLYRADSQLGREVYVALLDQLCRSFEDVAREAITWLIYAKDDRKLDVPVTVALLRSGLVSVASQDEQLAKSLHNDARPALLEFAAGLIRECLSCEPPIGSQSLWAFTIDALDQFSRVGKANAEVNALLDDIRGVRRAPALPGPDGLGLITTPAKTETDQLREKLYDSFQQWVSIYQRSPSPEKAFVPFITQLTKQGILKVEDVSSFFFRVCAESSVSFYLKCGAAGEFANAFQGLDAMARLIVYIIKYHGDASGVNNDQAKVHYLTKILSIFVLVLANMHEEQGQNFHQKPFFRFFSSLVNDLHAIEAQLGTAYFQLLIAISDTLSSLQPTYFPGFAFAWMSLISHRLFMPKLLSHENREGWSAFHKLLLSLFKFLSPFLKTADFNMPARDLYRGTLRLLLVLLHDFPEFLSEYYFTLCDIIPPRCIQLRNIILSAFPASLVLPDPHLRDVKNSLPEMRTIPPILSDFTAGLKNGDLRDLLDQHLLGRGAPSTLPSLKERLRLPGVPEGVPDAYNLSLINSVVMYIGISSVAQSKAKSGSSLFLPNEPGVVLLQYWIENFDAEGQHHILSSVVMHLRYPNAHTHWFSQLLLHLFCEIKDPRFREIVTKVLLERFIVHRPHPWGALATFIELLGNPKYGFWNEEFVRVTPEVTLLLESVSRSLVL